MRKLFNRNHFLLLILVGCFCLFLFVNFAQAGPPSLWSGIEDCQINGNCTLNSAERFVVNIATRILAMLGVVALVVFIYGGLMWITSAGSAEKVSQGKNAITGAVVGIVIVLFAYVIVYNFLNIVGVENNPLKKSAVCYTKWPTCSNVASGPWQEDCKGEDVFDIQERLNNLNCGDLSKDGCFGSATRSALAAFQVKNPACGRTDGVMDDKTYIVIRPSDPSQKPVPCQ